MADEKPEVQDRVKKFNEEFMPLLAKYRLALGAVALILPDGRIAAKPQLFDDPPKTEEAPKESGLAAA